MNKLARKELIERILESVGESDWPAEDMIEQAMDFMEDDALEGFYSAHHSALFEDE